MISASTLTYPEPEPDTHPHPNPPLWQSGAFSLTIGGDHSIAAASIAAVQAAYPTLGVIWVDAHVCHTGLEPQTSRP